MNEHLPEKISVKFSSLPGDLFGLKSDYLGRFPEVPALLGDVDGGMVKLGQAGERLARGILESRGRRVDGGLSFDRLLAALNEDQAPVPVTMGLRTVLKYRNQAAHDSSVRLSIHDLDAAAGAFCAAYQAAWHWLGENEEMSRPDPGADPGTGHVPSPFRRIFSDTAGRADFSGTSKINRSFLTGILCLITSGFLVKAVAAGGPSSFFMLLRMLVTASSILLVYSFYIRKHILLLAVSGVAAVLFNPLYIIQLSRNTWRIIDLILLCWFLFWGQKMLREKPGSPWLQEETKP